MSSKVEELVNSFRALPVDDAEIAEWYFDIRYIPFYPPYHLLTVFHPSTGRLHSERIIVDGSPLKYFPETAAEAGSPAAIAVLRSFVALELAPRKLSTYEDGIAKAITAKLEKLGVDLHVCVAIQETRLMAERLFRRHFSKLAAYAGYDPADIHAPTNISFDDFPKKGPLLRAILNTEIPDTINALFAYIHEVSNSEPPMGKDVNAVTSRIRDRVFELQQHVDRLPLHIVKRRAEEGDVDAAFDYGMRLWVGLGCDPDRHKAYMHLVHAAISPSASDFDRARAHGVLTSWLIPEGAPSMRPRDVIASAYHANESAILGHKISPPGSRSSPYILRFMEQVFLRMVGGLPHIRLLCEDAQKAWQEYEAQCAAEDARMNRKMASNPARYRCANPGCEIEADTGKRLNQCAGKCDVGKKPHYCSKACQIADWKHHKSSCNPGAESSVAGLSARWVRPNHQIHYKPLNPEDDETSAPRAGAFQVQLPDGQTLSSTTLDPETLKAVAGHSAIN